VRFFPFFKKRFFSKEEEKKIVEAIRSAESGTSGEVRVHFSSKLVNDVLTDAKLAFEKLGMHQTERRNGVLIYIVPSERQFAIVGDEGFHHIAGDDFWQSVKDKMQNFFKDSNFAEGMLIGLQEVGEILKHHFPRQDNDKNELKDEISYGE
jgi:uncharacterized membrane protein